MNGKAHGNDYNGVIQGSGFGIQGEWTRNRKQLSKGHILGFKFGDLDPG